MVRKPSLVGICRAGLTCFEIKAWDEPFKLEGQIWL
jgi:hypothetical protein